MAQPKPQQKLVKTQQRKKLIRANGKPWTRPAHPGEPERMAERRIKALALRAQGYTYRAIGQELGVDIATAWTDVRTELEAVRQATRNQAEEILELELRRCDEWTRHLTPVAAMGDSKAVMALVRISERRAKLLGLDKPTELKHSFQADEVRASLREKLARLMPEQSP